MEPCAHGERARRLVLGGTVLGSSLAFIDGSAVSLALPVMQRELGGDMAAAQWIMNAYMLLLGALVLAGGAAADRYGRKRVFLAGVVVFTVASVACGFAPSLPTLIGARALQGVGAALLTPASLALLGATFDDRARGQAVGIWAGASGLTSALGPVLGGWLTETISWRAVFLINVPLAALAIWLVVAGATESRAARAGPVDLAGAATATLGLLALTWALTDMPKRGAGDPWVLGALALGAAALTAFLLIERRAKSPMAPLNLFRSVAFSGLNAYTLLLYAAFSGALFLLPFLLIRAHGAAPAAAGAALVPLSIGLAVLSPLAGRLKTRLGARPLLVAGPVLVAAGFLLLSLRAEVADYWTGAFSGLCLLACGMGLAVAPLTDGVLGAVPDEYEGAASGINNAVARIAGLIAVALVGFVMQGSDTRAIEAGYRVALHAAAAAALGAAVLAAATVPGRKATPPACGT